MSRFFASNLVKYACLFAVCLAAPAVLAEASLDIRPSVCPNVANVQARGIVPVAIVSDVDFGASRVDFSTLELTRSDGVGGTATPRMGHRGSMGHRVDVAAPAAAGMCSTFGVDGLYDFLVFFGQADVVNRLELADVASGTVLEVCVSGQTRNLSGSGEPFRACDLLTVTGFGNLASPQFDGIGTLPRMRR